MALDDTLGVKHLASRLRLIASAEYRLLEEDTRTRNGFAIFVRRAWEHAALTTSARDRAHDQRAASELDRQTPSVKQKGTNGSNVVREHSAPGETSEARSGEPQNGSNVGKLPPRALLGQSSPPKSDNTQVTALEGVETALGATGDGGGAGGWGAGVRGVVVFLTSG